MRQWTRGKDGGHRSCAQNGTIRHRLIQTNTHRRPRQREQLTFQHRHARIQIRDPDPRGKRPDGLRKRHAELSANISVLKPVSFNATSIRRRHSDPFGFRGSPGSLNGGVSLPPPPRTTSATVPRGRICIGVQDSRCLTRLFERSILDSFRLCQQPFFDVAIAYGN